LGNSHPGNGNQNIADAEHYESTVLGPSMRLSGEVASGLGRAHIFMSQKHYQSQFKTILGMSAWPGTLNVEMKDESIKNYFKLRVIAGLDEGDSTEFVEARRIAGFERDGKSFGGATAFSGKVSVNGRDWIDCAVLIPDLTRHSSTAEVISGSFLRECLPCDDGHLVQIELN